MEVENYDATVNWAEQEEKARITRGQGISSFYLITGAIFVIVICFFVLYYGNRGRLDETDTLNMMLDPDNIYDEEFSYEEEIEQPPSPIRQPQAPPPKV